MRITHRALAFPFAALALAALSGCEDLEARKQASELNGKITTLSLDLDKAKARTQELEKKLEAAQSESQKLLGAGADKMREDMQNHSKGVLEKIVEDSKQTRENATTLVEGARSASERQMESVKNAMAEDIKKLRDELAATRDHLEKLMNNQLKELYPYAYQPKRLEPGSAPDPNKP